jgi:hypothetical protein
VVVIDGKLPQTRDARSLILRDVVAGNKSLQAGFYEKGRTSGHVRGK